MFSRFIIAMTKLSVTVVAPWKYSSLFTHYYYVPKTNRHLGIRNVRFQSCMDRLAAGVRDVMEPNKDQNNKNLNLKCTAITGITHRNVYY